MSLVHIVQKIDARAKKENREYSLEITLASGDYYIVSPTEISSYYLAGEIKVVGDKTIEFYANYDHIQSICVKWL